MSAEQHDLPPELKAFEATLAGLAPASAQLDRDRLFFAAGTATAPARAGRSWLARSLFALAASALAVALVFGQLWWRERQVVQAMRAQLDRPPVSVPPETSLAPLEFPPQRAAERGDERGYFRLRQVVLEQGLDGLEPANSGSREFAPDTPFLGRERYFPGT